MQMMKGDKQMLNDDMLAVNDNKQMANDDKLTMNRLKGILHEGGHSLVVERDGGVETFGGRGVSDLFRIVESHSGQLKGAIVADRIIGKGAAALMVLGGVRLAYADVVSRPALNMLQNNGVEAAYGEIVEHIINRQGDGICPVERLCAPCQSPKECLPLIRGFIKKMRERVTEPMT